MIRQGTTSEGSFVLRKTLGPTLFFVVLVSIAFLPLIPYIARTHDFSPISVLLVFAPIALWYAWVQTKYAISWQDGAITQRTMGGPPVIISVAEIYQVVLERSTIQQMVSLSRPGPRRLAIYARTTSGVKVVDVSLVHFKRDDVEMLMKLVHERRPELVLPTFYHSPSTK
jgi:hypothetical protein